MSNIRILSTPDTSYVDELLAAVDAADSMILVTAFASVAGIELIEGGVKALMQRGGSARIVLAVDRQGFNTSAVFERLLDLREALPAQFRQRLSLALVLQERGLLHAKALYTESAAAGPRLLVGSANLTRSALHANHELAVLIDGLPGQLRARFRRFVDDLKPSSLDGPDARAFLEARGLLTRSVVRVPKVRGPRGDAPSMAAAFAKLPPAPPLDVEAEVHLAGWIHRGYLVGKGRRTLDALVLRVPHEQLVRAGYLKPFTRKNWGLSSRETTSTGFGVELVPTEKSDQLRTDARRISLLQAKLTLNLPCFGQWMPETFWPLFVEQRDQLKTRESLSPDALAEVARRHRNYLETGGLESEVDLIMQRLAELDLIMGDKRVALRERILERFRDELRFRTPELIASCIEFRTARQKWSPFEHTEAPYRQLMVDIIQATFSSTFRTGDWPRTFRSHPARQIADAVEQRIRDIGGAANASAATTILEDAATWELDASMSDAVHAFRRYVPDDISFVPPTIVQDEEDGDTDEL